MEGKRASRRTLPGVLHNLLGTLTNRYADHDGYWIFGLLERQLDGLTVDLLAQDTAECGSDRVRVQFIADARRKFREQHEKAGHSRDVVQTATLAISMSSANVTGAINGRAVVGSQFVLRVTVRSDLGVDYTRNTQIFVAPHNPDVEGRSTRRV